MFSILLLINSLRFIHHHLNFNLRPNLITHHLLNLRPHSLLPHRLTLILIRYFLTINLTLFKLIYFEGDVAPQYY